MTWVIFSAESCLAVDYLNLTYRGKNHQDSTKHNFTNAKRT